MRNRTHLASLATTSILGLLLLLLGAAGCGSSQNQTEPLTDPSAPCADAIILGSWTASMGGFTDTLTFRADCTATSSYCQTTFSYPDTTAPSGTAMVHVSASSSVPGCMGT